MNYETVPIKKIAFQLLTNEQIKNMSISKKEQYGITGTDISIDGNGEKGGLLDPRLGTTDSMKLCATCGETQVHCVGHFGHTELGEMIYNDKFMDIMKNILECICLGCSKLLISNTEEEINEIIKDKKGKNRFLAIRNLTSKIKNCSRKDQNCGIPVSKIKKEPDVKSSNIIRLIAETSANNGNEEEEGKASEKKKIKQVLNPRKIYNILKNVSDTDYRIMGFDPTLVRGEDFIMKYFPIPPIAIRPSVKMSISSSTNHEDMLTSTLRSLLKASNIVRSEKEKKTDTQYLNQRIDILQLNAIQYVDNEKIKHPISDQKNGGKIITSISLRLKGKTGRFRGNLMGKRVEFSARTVITSDPNLSLNELGVPIKIAMNLTFPETVTAYNIEELQKLVRNGPKIYPGANSVIPKSFNDGGKIELKYNKKGVKLRPGDIVTRHMKDGDPVLFNRQPSLHKLSMMCHKVKVINDENLMTFRINVSVTKPYNADFDGDEMNLHMPQSLMTQIELLMIPEVSRNIISPRHSKSVIVLIQDTIYGVYQLTNLNKTISWQDVMNYSMVCANVDHSKIVKKDIDSKQMFSMIIPSGINIYDKDKDFEIINGKIIKGIVSGNILNHRIIDYSLDKYGPEISKDIIDNSQKLILNYLLHGGFTISLQDAVLSKENKLIIKKFIQETILNIYHQITELENCPDLLNPVIFENSIFSKLSAMKGDLEKKALTMFDNTNHFNAIITSGAKGSGLNLSQIAAGLAQQDFNLGRINKKVNNRTSVHFCQNDDSPLARGFIEHAFIDGLHPNEFSCHATVTRPGLIDTAIKTSSSGYIQRKLIKGMEDIYIAYDGTVRSANGIIVQLLYGDSHINQIKQRNIKFNILKWSDKDIINICKYTDEEIKSLKGSKTFIKSYNDTIVDKLIDMRDNLRHLIRKASLNYSTVEDTFFQPANFVRIIFDVKNMHFTDNTILDPLYVSECIESVMDPSVCKLVCIKNKHKGNKNTAIYNNQLSSKYLFYVALNEYMNVKRCTHEYKFNKEKFDYALNEIIKSYNNSIVDPGEMVGVVSAQTLGEVLTQMSVEKNTQIYVKNKLNIVEKVSIGKFIDDILISNPNNVHNIEGHLNSVECIIDNYQICSINSCEKVSWTKISHVSRHPANGSLLKITTCSGKTITSTKSHNFLVRTTDGIIPITAKDLVKGTRIPIAKYIEYPSNNYSININDITFELNDLLGKMCGSFLSNGTIQQQFQDTIKCNIAKFKMQYDICEMISKYENCIFKENNVKSFDNNLNMLMETFIKNNNKQIPIWIHNSNKSFVQHFIKSFIDDCGIFIVNNIIVNSSEHIVRELSVLCSYFNVYCTIKHLSQNIYTLTISNEHVLKYYEKIGSNIPNKSTIIINSNNYIPMLQENINNLDTLLHVTNNINCDFISPLTLNSLIIKYQSLAVNNNMSNNDVYLYNINKLYEAYNSDVVWTEIVDIKEIIVDNNEYVYDFTVPKNETFMTADMIFVHNTLNTFHSTGSAVIGMTGIGRFTELLSNTKNLKKPFTQIYLIDKYKENKDFANYLGSMLKYTILSELTKQCDIIFDPDPINSKESYYNSDNIDKDNNSIFSLHTININIATMPWLFRITLSKDIVVENNILLLDIKTKFITFWTDYLDNPIIKKNEKDVLSKIINGCVMSSFDSSDNLIIHFRFELSNVSNKILSTIQDIILHKFNIHGSSNISKITDIRLENYVSFNKDDGSVISGKEYVIYTEGIDIFFMRKFKGIDFKRTICNDIFLTHQLYGIEAARTLLIKELNGVYDSSNNVNYAHKCLLADVMTNNGNITTMDRNGINRLDTDPIGKATFEQTVDQLVMASAFNEVDHLRGVSSRIAVGKCIKGGTGLCDIIIDTDMIENYEMNETKEIKSIENNFRPLEANNLISDILKNKNMKGVFIPN